MPLLVLIGLFTVDICSNTVKFEEAENSVTWSDQELDVPQARDGDNVVENDSHDALLGCDVQKVSADAVYVNLNELGDQRTDSIVFRPADLEDEDPIMQVMLKSIQDPELAPIYEGLPDLG